MKNHMYVLAFTLVALLRTAVDRSAVYAEPRTGRIAGRVSHESGRALGGVSVVINELSHSQITDESGRFTFAVVPQGTYSLTFILGEHVMTQSNILVRTAQTTAVEQVLDWEIGFAETITVVSASRRRERIVDAPSAVTTIDEDEIARNPSHGQLPKLLEFTPGVEVTQSGVYDYNFNTRGFNSWVSRRVAVLIDGRDSSIPFLGAQEWGALSFPLDDIASVELLRGPSAALVGANASSGVLNVSTRPPRSGEGGKLRFTAGELSTTNIDFRWAGGLGDDWYAKVLGGVRNHGDFTVSRVGSVEYSVPCAPGQVGDCLTPEAVPLARENDDRIFFGSARFDKYLSSGQLLTAEAGVSDVAGPVLLSGVGRVQLVELRRPWARFNFNTDRLNLLAYYNGRDAPKQLNLIAGANLALDEHVGHAEAQKNWSFAQEKLRLVVGASAEYTSIDSYDRELGTQTLLFEPVDSKSGALSSQLDWNISDRLKLVLAARWDASTLHDPQLSPKGSLVYRVRPDHNIRFSVNRAFQVPDYAELFAQADAAPPVDLSQLNALCKPSGTNCGLGITRVMVLGNEDLTVEEVSTFEVGYSGILAGKALLNVDYYYSEASNFITDLLPQLGTPLGRINPNFGRWQAPPGLPEPVAGEIRAAVPALSNNFDGSNIIAGVSWTNFGVVNTQGVDFAIRYLPSDRWNFQFSYSLFDFDIQDDAGLESLLLPNAPANKFSFGSSYVRDRWNASFSLRWVDNFRWAVGTFVGNVEAYTTADLVANYDLSKSWGIGINVANLFNDEHWESFGGDILKRRALVHLDYSF